MSAGIFNSAIFNSSVFNTGTSTPAAIVAVGGGYPAWRSETEARARKRSIEKFLLQKRNQEEQLQKNVRKLERKKREAPEPDLFEARINAALQALAELQIQVQMKRVELLDIDDYLDGLLDSLEAEEDEDDWLLLH